MRLIAKVDKNQPDIVADLRQMGYTVVSTAEMGKGFPDLIVGARGINFLFEIKNPDVPYADRQLNSDQELWHAAWRGRSYVVETTDDCLCIIKSEKWVM